MFEGFRDETMQFLWGVRLNNERSWFLEHKTLYEEFLYRPLKELGAEVQAGTAPAAAGEPVQCPRLPDLSGRPTPPRPGAVQRSPVVHPAPAGGAVGDSGAGVLL